MASIGIFPASGALGTSTYTHLLTKVPARQVTLISRFPEKVPPHYKTAGVTTRQASYESTPEELRQAFTGLDVLFLISYPSHNREYRTKLQHAAVEAAVDAGVSHLFYSSLAFAQNTRGTSVAEVMGSHLDTEAQLRQVAASRPGSNFTWTSIREGLYSESFPIYTSFWDIKNPSGEILIPHDGTGPGLSWVKRDELGEATAHLIAKHAALPSTFPYLNQIVSLTGPKEWTLAETVEVLDRAAGRDDVRIRSVSVDEYVGQPQVLREFGSETLARTWVTAFEAIRGGETALVTPLLGELLGREPEDYETTIRGLA